MLDRAGFRPNVGIILVNAHNQVLLGRRAGTNDWQFPQGGIDRGERLREAMYRELYEELGLRPEHVQILARTREWLRYVVPDKYIRRQSRGIYQGQKQIWYLLKMVGIDSDVDLYTTQHPEFDGWRWAPYWVELEEVIEFKREVYRLALEQLHRFLPPSAAVQSRTPTGPQSRLHRSDV